MQTIAVDIDDVLAANAEGFIKFSNQRYGTNLRTEDYQEHWAELWQIDHKETELRAEEMHRSGAIDQYNQIIGAREILEQLKKNYRLVLITSRRTSVKSKTIAWIETNYTDIFADICFTGIWDIINNDSHKKTKTALIKEVNANFLIDDQLKHCISASEAGIRSLLFGDYSWNRSPKLPQNVTRVDSWKEVKNYFDQI